MITLGIYILIGLYTFWYVSKGQYMGSASEYFNQRKGRKKGGTS